MKPYIKYLISLSNSHFLGNQTPYLLLFIWYSLQIYLLFNQIRRKKTKRNKTKQENSQMGFKEAIFLSCFKIFSTIFLRFLCEFSVSSCRQILKMGLSSRLVLYIYIEDSLGSNGNILCFYIIAPHWDSYRYNVSIPKKNF